MNQKIDEVWLDNLKPGDTIYIDCGKYNVQLVKRVVKKITKTQIVLNNDTRFRRRDGTSLEHDLFSHVRLVESTQANNELYEHQQYLERLKSTLYKANKNYRDIPIKLGNEVIGSLEMFLDSIN